MDDRERDRLDRELQLVSDASARWASASLRQRADLAREVGRRVGDVAERWTRLAADLKGLVPTSPSVGEEWMSGPYATQMGALTLAATLGALDRGRDPLRGTRLRPGADGRTVVRVLPRRADERLLLNGFRAEVWSAPGIAPADVRRRVGSAALAPGGGVSVVLGAGNISSIAPLDVLVEVLVHRRTAVLKLNPTFDVMISVMRMALAPLLELDVLRIVQGGPEAGDLLTHDPRVDHVHITGSAATHDAIVWGTGAEAERRRREGAPRLAAAITSELGGVSPVIVVPGPWTDRDLAFQARHVATMRLHNAGHNCIAAQVLIVPAEWDRRDRFLAEVRRAIHDAPGRPTWYPGASRRLGQLQERYPGSTVGPDRVMAALDPGGPGPLAEVEAFGPALGVIELEGDPLRYLEEAVAYANDRLPGTLGANLLVDPRSRRRLGGAIDDAVARLRYGTIAINSWTALGFLTAAAPWGAFPGATLDDIQSGIGSVHNGLLLDGIERTVVEGPFRPFPRSLIGGEASLFPVPPWFVTARSARATGRALSRYAARPGPLRLAAVLAHAFQA